MGLLTIIQSWHPIGRLVKLIIARSASILEISSVDCVCRDLAGPPERMYVGTLSPRTDKGIDSLALPWCTGNAEEGNCLRNEGSAKEGPEQAGWLHVGTKGVTRINKNFKMNE